MTGLDSVMLQASFGELVGVSQQAVSDLLARGVIRQGDTARTWLLAYCEHLRTVAAGRDPDGELATARTRVANATAQRIEMQNKVARGKYAPIELLTDVLANASAAVAARLDALAAELPRRFPQLDELDRTALMALVASARNTWVTESAELTVRALDEFADDADPDDPALELVEDVADDSQPEPRVPR